MAYPINGKSVVILLAEDMESDQVLIKRAFKKGKIKNELHIVDDGQKALDYLRHEGGYEDKRQNPRPDLILLDINMPRVDGKEALKLIKNDPRFNSIPVCMLTTSNGEKDVFESFNLGVNAYLQKPIDMAGFFDIILRLEQFWFQLTILPNNDS